MGVLTELLERLCAFEEAAVMGSKAYPAIFVRDGGRLYWTNQVSLPPPQSTHGSKARLFTATVTARLHRGPVTITLTDGGKTEAACIEDLTRVGEAMADNRDLISAAFPTAHANLYPGTFAYGGGRNDIFPSSNPDGGDVIGTVHTFTFSYYQGA